MENMIDLGTEVVDGMSGFRGIAVGRAEYLDGSAQYLVRARELSDGKPVAEWISSIHVQKAPSDKPSTPAESGDSTGP